MAGTIPLSMTQQFNEFGQPLAGGLLYFFQAGTVGTPQNAYQDTALTIAMPNPITLDAAGRIPQFFLADGQIKIRLQDASGIVQLAADNILVIGPSGGGGGGGGVDPTTVLQSGQLVCWYGTGVQAGFVRTNGRTIGSATSGGTERANADCQSLFLFLWNADPNLTVSGGRGATAAADWAANKTIALPDWRGRALVGLDDMGAAAAGRLTATYFGTLATVLGAAGGNESTTLLASQIPTITSVGNITVTANGGRSFPTALGPSVTNTNDNAGTFYYPGATGGWNYDTTMTGNGQTMASNNTGGAAHRTVTPSMLATIYMKL